VNPDRSVKLPEFCGEIDINKMSVMEYISAVEMSRNAGNWLDAIAAERVKLRLSGPARTWLNNIIRAETAGLNVFDPVAVAGAKPLGLRQLLTDGFMPQHTAAKQEWLRATLIQQENKSVNTFFNRVESIQFLLDQDLPDDFRRNHKASYDIVHNRQVQTSFIAGLKSDKQKLELTAVCSALEHLHEYLFGRKTIVYTDHKPLLGTSNIQKKTMTR
jgi:hypothetical protein